MTQVTFPYQQGLYVWTSPYGYRLDPLGRSTGQSFHGGVDIASRPTGRTIDTHSPVDGIVTVPAFEANGAGNNIWITDADQTLWKFFHLSAIYVRTGQRVKAGELVARMGTTGASTGVHGHIERWQGGAYGNRTDPTQYLRDAETAGRFPGAAVPAPAPTPTPTPTPAPQPPEEDIMVTRAENQADMAAAIKPVGRGDVVIGALNVGVLYDYDPETGIADFDPVATVLTSSMHSEDAPSRLNLDYPWANDLRDGSKCVFVMPSDAEARKLGLSGADLDEFKATVASKQPATRKLDKPPKR